MPGEVSTLEVREPWGWTVTVLRVGFSLKGASTWGVLLMEATMRLVGVKVAEVNISSYPVTRVTGLFLLSCVEIFKVGCFVQKYSDLGVSCRNIDQEPFCVTQSV